MKGEDQGAATDVAGLSQVDPLRVSPPDGASIPSARNASGLINNLIVAARHRQWCRSMPGVSERNINLADAQEEEACIALMSYVGPGHRIPSAPCDGSGESRQDAQRLDPKDDSAVAEAISEGQAPANDIMSGLTAQDRPHDAVSPDLKALQAENERLKAELAGSQDLARIALAQNRRAVAGADEAEKEATDLMWQRRRAEERAEAAEAALAESERKRVEDKDDAERFRALMRCGRIKPQGSAGVHPLTGDRKHPESPGAVHFGAEFWVQPEEVLSPLTVWGRHCLRALADDILAYEATPTQETTHVEG